MSLSKCCRVQYIYTAIDVFNISPCIVVQLFFDVVSPIWLWFNWNILAKNLILRFARFERSIALNRRIARFLIYKRRYYNLKHAQINNIISNLRRSSKISDHFHQTHNYIICYIFVNDVFIICFGTIKYMATKMKIYQKINVNFSDCNLSFLLKNMANILSMTDSVKSGIWTKFRKIQITIYQEPVRITLN